MRHLTDYEISDKHYRLRGSMALKYPPNESRCRTMCGVNHDQAEKACKPHRCFLAVKHEGECEFSSACTAMPETYRL